MRGLRRLAVCGVALVIGVASAAGADESRLIDPPGARELTPAELRARPAPFPAPVGERLRYAVSYWGLPLGTAEIEVLRYLELEGRRFAHIGARAETYPAFAWIYRVRDRAEALIDLDRVRTRISRTRMEHRRRRIYEEIAFDWETHFVKVLRERRHSGSGREVAFDFGPFAHDPLDLVYSLRRDPELGAGTVELPVYASRKIQGLRLVPAGRELVRTRATQRIPALRLHPEVRIDGQPRDDRGRGVLWIAAEGQRIPLRLAGWFRGSDDFRIGGVRAELVEYVPAAPGWEAVGGAGPAPSAAARRGAPSAVEGRPVWDVPEEIARLRHSRGIVERDERFRVAAGR
ncbi:MAG: DUF3108 domain-containing protein, partial [Proteobacteria bacterium]|nr:DUF3108 domain-containing protein [Pseudomonadota bacterium]